MTTKTRSSFTLADISADFFDGCIDTTFKLVSGDVSMSVKLANCRENPID